MMQILRLGFSALLFQASSVAAKHYTKNVPTFEVGPDVKITGNKIEYSDPECDPGLSCMKVQTCAVADAVPTLSSDEKYFACCLKGQRLLGGPDTAFDCCAAGHDLAGSADTGYHCCPTGYSYDGQICKLVCKNGKKLVDGKCVCPDGTIETGDGTCKRADECKCYTFTSETGHRLGLQKDGFYLAAPESMTQRRGKFKLCFDEKCTPGQAVNPSTEVYIKDVHGDLATGANNGQWLNNAKDGAHIGRTPTFANAGKFALSKWPCGKYCLGGFHQGVGPACPAETPAMTFYSQDPQMCVAFELTEVPCDIKADANNCIWDSGDQCCNKVNCNARFN